MAFFLLLETGGKLLLEDGNALLQEGAVTDATATPSTITLAGAVIAPTVGAGSTASAGLIDLNAEMGIPTFVVSTQATAGTIGLVGEVDDPNILAVQPPDVPGKVRVKVVLDGRRYRYIHHH